MDTLISKYQTYVSELCGVECSLFDVNLKAFESEHDCYCTNCSDKCDFKNTHLYGCYEAVRWGHKYIYYCPKGFIFIAIAIINELDIMDSGVITGPILMGNPEDFEYYKEVPLFTTVKVQALTEILQMLFSNVSNFENYSADIETEAFLNDLYKIIDEVVTTANITYPIELEKDLQDAIVHGDSVLSKELLNKLLGHIFFNSNGDFATIKARVLELIVLLSRSAIEGGANIKEIFALNSNYLKEVENFRNIEKLSVWLTSVINRFVSYVFEFGEVKHTDTIYKVTGYIKENYSKKISLDEIAKHVYLSKSYLSKIFKEEMGLSITTYINNYRIEKGKILIKDDSLSLVDIANMIGFDDQGYFTKVFKASVGISPGKYREKQGKV